MEQKEILRVDAPAAARLGHLTAMVERRGRNLQEVNDRLKDLIGELAVKKSRLGEVWAAGESRSAPPAAQAARPSTTSAPAGPPPPPPREEAALRRATAELAAAREALAATAAARDRLAARVLALEAEGRRRTEELASASEAAGELIQRCAALERIHGAADAEALLQALQELVVNVVGSEELAILELQDGAPRVALALGLPPGALTDLAAGRGTIGAAMSSGRTWVAGRGEVGDDERLTAVLPLRDGPRVVGAIVIYRLLGHRPGLGPADQATFDLLEQHGGAALALRRPRSA